MEIEKSFEGINKVGKYLAWQLKKKREYKTINLIKDGGKEFTDQGGIQRSFSKFYAKLFQKEPIKNQRLKNICKIFG